MVQFSISRSGYLLRTVASQDERAFRMLLPKIRDVALAMVAVDHRHKMVVAGAALTRQPRLRPMVGPGVAVHVIEPCRRNGIAITMIDELARRARAAGAQALYGIQRVELDSREMREWQWLGFSACETVREHVLPLAEFEPRLGPVLDRLRDQRRIPSGAEIIPLYRADPDAVLELHLTNMGGNRNDLYRKLRNEIPGAFHPRYSRVLLIDGAVQGCILAHRGDRDTAVVDANILAPAVRGSWANVWLKLEATCGALSLGIKHFHFTTFDHYSDTRRFAGRFGGRTLRSKTLMYRIL
jgi:N-acetylglutamate synthase-like GNAT family acetyltransferase